LEGNACNICLAIGGVGKATVDGDFADWREKLRKCSGSNVENPPGYDSDASNSLHSQ